MSRWSRIILSLALSILLASTLAGCLEELMDSRCPPTYVAASWTQEGLWESLPEEGEYGPYNLSYHEPEGFPFEDPEWGSLVLTELTWDPQWENAPRDSVFRLRSDEQVTITTSPEKEAEDLEDGFLEFTSRVTTAEEETRQDWLKRFVENGSKSDYTTAIQSRDGETDEIELVDHSIEIAGPYDFEALYDELLEKHGSVDERPDPWQGEGVQLGPWSFWFQTTTVRIIHMEESGRQMHITNSGHAGFQWDPPKGAGPDALYAGITRTFLDIGLDRPAAMDQMELLAHSC